MESGKFSSFPVKYGGRRDAGALDEKKLAWQGKMAKVRVPLPDGHSTPRAEDCGSPGGRGSWRLEESHHPESS